MIEQRRLAALVAVDVVGYSRLMGRDEAGTVARLRQVRAERLEPILARRGGRIVKLTGDGALIEFASAVEALSAAIEFQQAMAEGEAERPEAERIVFRLGVHLGDVIVDGDDLYGDGVNVAARLEAKAPAGGIMISGDMYNVAAPRVAATFEDLGRLALKNIERPVQAYAVHWGANDWPVTAPSAVVETVLSAPSTERLLPLPDKPSIAVLPFQNMSGDPEQEYFADGIVEDIITALSRFKSLFVIARNSSFTYKGKAVDVRQVGRELGVRYVLEGSVRKAGKRLRLTGQLIDSGTGSHLWAERFDGALEDVFDLQDRITTSVVGAIMPKLDQAEIDRAMAKRTESLGSYDHLLRGLANLHRLDKASTSQALDHFREAIRLDPTSSAAHGWAVIAYSRRRQSRWMIDVERESDEGLRLGRQAIELAKDDAFALGVGGFAIAFLGDDLDAGLAFIDRALALNPNLATAWQASGWVRSYVGDPDTAIEHLTQSIRLSPIDPHLPQLYIAMAVALRCAGRYAESAEWAQKALREAPNLLPAWITLAAAHALAGRLDDARDAAQRALQIDPSLRMPNFSHNIFFRRPQDRAAMRDGLRLAGIPD